MQAWQVNGQGEPGEVMRRVDTELESIRPGELHVEVVASGLGLPDVFMCRGTYPLAAPPPFTPGQEFVGTVCATGEGVSIPVGARVMGVAGFMIGRGAFASRCTTYEQMVYPAPDTIGDAEAAAFTIAFHTAHIALVRRAAMRAGETLLVHGGAGGSGCAAIQLGKALGARVIATARGTERLAFCSALGADCVIDYGAGEFTEQVNAASGGRGADVVFDPVGGEVFEASLRCTAPEGRLLPIGFACGRWGQIPTRELALRNIAVVGAMVGGFERDYMLRMHEELLGLHASGAIRVAIDRQIGFDEIPEGLQALAERRVCGRIVAVRAKTVEAGETSGT